LVILVAVPAFGGVIKVTNTSDSSPGSLRDAIASAADGDTIEFNLPLPNTIVIGSPLVLDSAGSKTFTIKGPDALSLAINGADGVSVFIVQPLGGGGGPVTATISGLTIEHGSSLVGGGIFNGGTLSLVDCVVRDNTVDTQFGAGIFNVGRLNVTNCFVANNSAGDPDRPGHGGGIYNEQGTVTLTRTAVSGNTSHQGAGIWNAQGEVVALRTTIVGNVTDDLGQGGGIFNKEGGQVTVTESTVGENAAGVFGGGIYNASAALTVIRSTIAGNVADTPLTTSPPRGGGIYNEFGTLDMINSTVSNNHAKKNGGGIFTAGGAGTIVHSTISGNSTQLSLGGGVAAHEDFSTALKFANTIVADNGSDDCFYVQSLDLQSLSLGYNLSSDLTCPFLTPTDKRGVPADLDPAGLKNNGGPTRTVALLSTSAAVNVIPLSRCTDAGGTPVTTDQRGIPRPQGPKCDIGAFELSQSRFLAEVIDTLELISAVSSSPLPPGQQQGLIAPLEKAADSLARNAVTPAVNQLGAFMLQANALTDTGVLTPELGTELTTGAQNIIDSLNSP
jgi:hypothetical protein